MAEPHSNWQSSKDFQLRNHNSNIPKNSESFENSRQFHSKYAKQDSHCDNWPANNIRNVVYRKLSNSLLVPVETSKEPSEFETKRNSQSFSENLKQELEIPGMKQIPHRCHLLRVSERAEKLNQMIRSLSEGINFDDRSKDIASDLLRGALDLEESLIMLGRLQQASKFMARLKKKKMHSKEEEEGELRSDGIENKNFDMEKPRASFDGSSSFELREVIRDSLYRQNLDILSDPDFSFASSNRPSNVSSINAGKSLCFGKDEIDGLFFETSQEHKKKKPNLIAKLMGLEELPQETVRITNRKSESKKGMNLNPRQPIFDIDIPKPKMTQIVDTSSDVERRTLKNIIETMQFKGLLKSSHGEEVQSHFSSSSQLKFPTRGFEIEKSDMEIPPIVIIKPLELPCLERQETENAKPIQEHGVLEQKQKPQRIEPTKSETRKVEEKPSVKIKKPVSQHQINMKEVKKPEINVKKRKPTSNRSNLGEETTPSSTVALRSQVPVKFNSSNRLVPANGNVLRKKITSENDNLVSSKKPISANSIDQKKKNQKKMAKPVKKSSVTNTPAKKSKHKMEEEAMNSIIDSEIQIKEIGERGETASSEIVPETEQHETSFEFESKTAITNIETAQKELKHFLTRSSVFIDSSEKLFGPRIVNKIRVFQSIGAEDVKTKNGRLVLDCATELLTRKSMKMEHGSYPLFRTHMPDSKTDMFLDQLADEIAKEIENLSNYGNAGADFPAADSLYVKYQKDLGKRGVEGQCVWDLGWENGASLEEVEEVAEEVEKQVLSMIIEEIITDLVYWQC